MPAPGDIAFTVIGNGMQFPHGQQTRRQRRRVGQLARRWQAWRIADCGQSMPNQVAGVQRFPDTRLVIGANNKVADILADMYNARLIPYVGIAPVGLRIV